MITRKQYVRAKAMLAEMFEKGAIEQSYTPMEDFRSKSKELNKGLRRLLRATGKILLHYQERFKGTTTIQDRKNWAGMGRGGDFWHLVSEVQRVAELAEEQAQSK